MRHCPKWVLSVIAVQSTRQYISGHVPLLAYAASYSSILAQHYDDVSKQKLCDISEEMMAFLVEINAGNLEELFSSFIYYTTTFQENGDVRKMKTLFKSAFAPDNSEATVEEVAKSFRVYTFRFRAKEAETMPEDWEITDVERIDWLGDLFELDVKNSSLGV